MKREIRAKIKILIGLEEMLKTLRQSISKNIFKGFKKNNIYKKNKKSFYNIYDC